MKKRPSVFLRVIIIIVTLCVITPVSGNSLFSQFKDPKDGALDTSNWLVDRKGFLPVPLVISDPAVGYGGGAALLFFHKSARDKEEKETNDEDDMLALPPSISFAAGAYTENDSGLVGGGHFGSWRNDAIRYTGAAGGASINLKFYGELALTRYDDIFGGDFDYTHLKASSLSWWGVLSNVVLGVRLDGRFINGDAPFWSVPFIEMRGIPSLRYQGDNAFVAEIEPLNPFLFYLTCKPQYYISILLKMGISLSSD